MTATGCQRPLARLSCARSHSSPEPLHSGIGVFTGVFGEAVVVARQKSSTKNPSRTDILSQRLELIKKRHRELILHPREMIAADLDSDFDSFEEAEGEELQLAEAGQL